MELGYSQNPGLLQKHDLRVYSYFRIPVLLAFKNKAMSSWEIDLGANASLFSAGRFSTIADIRFFLMRHHQALGTFLPVGIHLHLTPAYHFLKGYLGFQIGWNQTVVTHISHSDYVKNTFADLTADDHLSIKNHPEDGWYGNMGSHLCFGLENGWEVGSRLFLLGDLGLILFSSPYSGMFNAMSMGQVPIYFNIRLFYKI